MLPVQVSILLLVPKDMCTHFNPQCQFGKEQTRSGLSGHDTAANPGSTGHVPPAGVGGSINLEFNESHHGIPG